MRTAAEFVKKASKPRIVNRQSWVGRGSLSFPVFGGKRGALPAR
jgi:hypothetical protein